MVFGFIFQIYEEANNFSFQTELRVVVAYGGIRMRDQVITAFLCPLLFLNMAYIVSLPICADHFTCQADI